MFILVKLREFFFSLYFCAKISSRYVARLLLLLILSVVNSFEQCQLSGFFLLRNILSQVHSLVYTVRTFGQMVKFYVLYISIFNYFLLILFRLITYLLHYISLLPFIVVASIFNSFIDSFLLYYPVGSFILHRLFLCLFETLWTS